MIGVKLGFVMCMGLLFTGCANIGDYHMSNTSKVNLTSQEIMKLISGKTLYLDDDKKTREFFDKDGRLYDYYTRDEEGYDGKWYIKDNELCLQYQNSKVGCKKVQKVSNGYVVDDELVYKIVKGDKFNIKNSFDWGSNSIEYIKLW